MARTKNGKKQPKTITKMDERTPQQIIGSIEQQGRIVSEALGRLATLLETREAL